MQDMVRMICVTVAQRAPEYGLGALVLDLLQVDAGSAWDGVMIGLRSLLAILLAAPAQALGNSPGQAGQVSLLCGLIMLNNVTCCKGVLTAPGMGSRPNCSGCWPACWLHSSARPEGSLVSGCGLLAAAPS